MATVKKTKSKGNGPDSTRGAPAQVGFQSGRELIVLAKREAGLRATRDGVASVASADVTPLADLLASEGVAMQSLFGVNEERLNAEAASIASAADMDVPDLSVYYWIDAPDERLDELAGRLCEQETVEAAYVKSPGELPVAPAEEIEMLNDMPPAEEEPPINTPDFTPRQDYLDAAPGGIDARYAWTVSGGRGAGVNIIDLEWGWRFTHEDLRQNQGGVVAGTNSSALRSENHGTAVIGEFSGDRNSFGVTGICPDARVSAVAFSMPTATAIRQAANRLRSGDIMLLEIHRAGPRFNFAGRNDQRGYIAIEWWPDDFDAIRYAVSKGIIVVEAAGNGRENLDDPIYNTRPAGFPTGWTNPFNRTNRDSGAIVVGAGAPPPGTHGRNNGPDRSRLGFSNYGALIDAQGWGREVTSTGYGDLQGGTNRDEWYTDRFSGTSSASPIVVGALGCVQGVLRRRGRIPLSPARARELLRATGSPQQNATGRPRTQR
ncbi:MAG: S8 family peptidase, partial [bacterium]